MGKAIKGGQTYSPEELEWFEEYVKENDMAYGSDIFEAGLKIYISKGWPERTLNAFRQRYYDTVKTIRKRHKEEKERARIKEEARLAAERKIEEERSAAKKQATHGPQAELDIEGRAARVEAFKAIQEAFLIISKQIEVLSGVL